MNLREIRKARGLTGEEVAKRMNISRGTYSLWENEKVPFTIVQACDLCDIFDCTLDQLAGRERRSDGTWAEIEDIYLSLNGVGREKLAEYAEDLASNPRNTQKSLRDDSAAV